MKIKDLEELNIIKRKIMFVECQVVLELSNSRIDNIDRLGQSDYQPEVIKDRHFGKYNLNNSLLPPENSTLF